MDGFWIVLLVLLALCVLLFWWNRKQLSRPREKWERFTEARRRDWDEE